jgi:hypothetical protein
MRTPKQIERFLDDLNREMVKLKKAVNQGAAAGKSRSDAPGKSGDIRVINDMDKFYLEVRTAQGWARSTEDTFKIMKKGV